MTKFVTGNLDDYWRLQEKLGHKRPSGNQTMSTEKYQDFIQNQNPTKRGGQTGKYSNTITEYNGKLYDSKKEAERHEELEWMQQAGEIHSLESQKKFWVLDPFEYHGEHVRGNYILADSYYYDNEKQTWVAEDTKSEPTRKKESYRIKKKLFMQRYPDILFYEHL